MRRIALCLLVLAASACGGAIVGKPTPAPTAEPTAAGVAVPPGPILFEPQQLILPPEAFPVRGAAVSHDAAVAGRGWERQFTTDASPDFRWFSVRLFVLDPDVTAAAFVKDNGCGSVTWPTEVPTADALVASNVGEAATACLYTFRDDGRVLYVATGYRNVGLLVGTQPRRDLVSNALAIEWASAIARQQISIIEKILIAHPPPTVRDTSGSE
ncbi:MAG: hypothetical protein KGN00_05145 [Chloroflexota bacterium]|nr:hypothetical protein [Chloroflexota bacterium]MDE3193054.1 hypothetical protein [Chloroflexota bacterium]